MKSISILGVYVADLAFFADEIPIIGETIIGKEYFIGPGGKGSNQAVAAAKAGAKTFFISKIGDDQFGSMAKKIYDEIRSEMEKKHKVKLEINFGTMLEVVRACLTSDQLVKTAEFFSFGTNDLTQAVFSFSREDAEGKFLPEYMEKDLLETSPFQSIDENGVGDLMKIAISQGRKHKKDLEIGICGEHGGDPNSIKFCHSANISYVSASPHRIPIALVAAAQAAINQKSVTSK